jgi:NAD(P)-dependent dehydrogenase (short-subunit alcohol dehydrogenase family)
MELQGATAIVTGGARGIGRGIAYELAKEGVRVAVADLPAVAAEREETIAEIKRLGSDAFAVDVDVRDLKQAQAMVDAVVGRWGQVDILVNNAGVIRIGPVAAFSEDDWDLVIDVNLKGTFLCSKAAVPHMMSRRTGSIINLSSIAGKHGRAMSSCYSASKFAVIGIHAVAGARDGGLRRHGERDMPGRSEHAHVDRRAVAGAGRVLGHDGRRGVRVVHQAAGAAGARADGRGHGTGGGVPVQGR